ncbi:MAG: toll/interleukin-1 receptor domain-containing protein [Clostridia bacterium]|nr:toll/interleukin-1 receptor domain-containing protein [Clostridia bacterium]
MAVFKCKMCGASLDVRSGSTIITCEYCGSTQTLPHLNDELIANLFNRANNLRLKCEFDKAAQVYEKILNENNSMAEAHWGLLLCKYGIEYVEDPKTYKRIPTCHRTQYESILSDVDYLAALANSDGEAKEIYKNQAQEIANLQKDILTIVKNEKPFDVFICYKETDENGKRTVDSTLANDIYYQLTREGLKVFYAAITLEDKLGIEYEPYIFAALNSAKAMLVIGTKPEHFDSVWVKNEWSRYLKIIKTDRSKMLIPCYRDMDAYDLPEEFSHLQAQDMSKIGFVNDIVRGIQKIAGSSPDKEPVIVNSAAGNSAALLKRAFLMLEDGDFARADEFCEQVLNIDAENAQAYLGKLMVEYKARTTDDLKKCFKPIFDSGNFQKAQRFGDAAFNEKLEEIVKPVRQYFEELRIAAEKAAKEAEQKRLKKAKIAKIFLTVLLFAILAAIAGFILNLTVFIPQGQYNDALKLADEGKYEEAISMMEGIPDYKDSAEQIKLIEEKQIESAMPDYDFGKVIENPKKSDFNVFYNMIKTSAPVWQSMTSFVSESTETKEIIENIILSGSTPIGIFYHFDFEKEYVLDPHFVPTEEEKYATEYCRYNAGDIDWLLKAIFDKNPIRYRRSTVDWTSLYFEDKYFYRFSLEAGAGIGITDVVKFTPKYKEIEDNVYKFTINATTEWEYDYGETQDYKWEFVATPMKSKDFGTYWKIISFTQLNTK